MTGQVMAHKPLRSAPESEVRDSYFHRFWKVSSCLTSLILKMWSPQIQEMSLSRFRLLTKVSLWAGMWSHRRHAAVSLSTTPSSTVYRKDHSSVSPPQSCLKFTNSLKIFISSFLLGHFCHGFLPGVTVNSTEQFISLKDLKPDTQYSVYVKATARTGSTKSSDTLFKTTRFGK